MKLNILFIVFVGLIGSSFLANAQEKSKIELLRANTIKSDQNIKRGARRLIGNVKFKQDSTLMECDSAYFYSDKNMFEAFGHVHLYKQGSTDMDVKSDYLRHSGDLKMAYFRHNVVLRDTQVVMETDSLDFDIQREIGYYLYGADIIDSATTLTSVKGHYYGKQNTIYFKKDVVINHNSGEYQMYSDTIKYNTIDKIAYFFGPTEIYNDTNYLYSEYGWYNTKLDQTLFTKNALYTNPNQSITADSLYYDRKLSQGKCYTNVVVTDTLEQMVVKGDFLEIFKEEDVLRVTKNPQLIHVLNNDTLYLHGDTLLVNRDSTGENRQFSAFKHVKIFKSDFQAKTDSLFFSMTDSILEFHGSPVLWAEENQITAGYIEAFVVNNALDRFKLYESGLIVSYENEDYYNQIKGNEMIGYLRNNQLSHIDVFKKSETIYFPVDEEGIVGVNKSTASDITVRMQDGQLSRIIYRKGYKGTMYPLAEVNAKDLQVRDFIWLEDWRPRKPEDIFIWEGSGDTRIIKEVPDEIFHME